MKHFAKDYLGEDKVVDLPLRMSSEDFSFYSQESKGCFYRLGISKSFKELSTGVHTPTFHVDEKSLKIGSGLMANLVYKQLTYS